MPVDFSGEWQIVSSEGLEEYLRSIKTPEDKIKEAAAAKTGLTIKQSGDNFTVTSGLLQETSTYTIGKSFAATVNGHVVDSVPSWDGDKLVLKTTSPEYEGKEHITTRELVGGKLVQKLCVVGGPTATRTFEKK